MTNEEKLKNLCEWLKELGVEYLENAPYTSARKRKYNINVVIPQYSTVVILNEKERRYYYVMRSIKFAPVFVRENETYEFLKEKVTNCCLANKYNKLINQTWRHMAYSKKIAKHVGIEHYKVFYKEFFEKLTNLGVSPWAEGMDERVTKLSDEYVEKYHTLAHEQFKPKRKRQHIKRPVYEKVSEGRTIR
jgi:hypothetical protein